MRREWTRQSTSINEAPQTLGPLSTPRRRCPCKEEWTCAAPTPLHTFTVWFPSDCRCLVAEVEGLGFPTGKKQSFFVGLVSTRWVVDKTPTLAEETPSSLGMAGARIELSGQSRVRSTSSNGAKAPKFRAETRPEASPGRSQRRPTTLQELRGTGPPSNEPSQTRARAVRKQPGAHKTLSGHNTL